MLVYPDMISIKVYAAEYKTSTLQRSFIFVKESRSKYILKGQRGHEKTHPKSKL